jgi:hypothetical protein
VSPVRYKLGFYIREDDILLSHRRELIESYVISICCCRLKVSNETALSPKSEPSSEPLLAPDGILAAGAGDAASREPDIRPAEAERV